MKKLLQLNVTANWGSTGRIVEGIGVVAKARGWDSIVAYGRSNNPSHSQLIEVGNKADVYLHYLRNMLRGEEGLGSKRATVKLIKEIELIHPDVIQLHNIHDHWLNYPELFTYLAKIEIPIFWTFHDCWAFTGGCYHFENNDCFKWIGDKCAICNNGYKNSRNNYLLKEKFIAGLGSRLNIIGLCDWIGSYIQQSMFHQHGANIHIIKNGVDVDSIFKPSGEHKNKYVLGVSNVWNASKGLDDFYKLRSLLPSEIGMCLVGLKENQVNQLPDGIIGFTRTQNTSELVSLYSRALVLINPTYNDTFPTVNIEALACGTPVVTYRTGGSPEAVDENTGIVVEKGDVMGLKDAIEIILSKKDRYTVKQCRGRAVRFFNKDIQFNKYIDLYNEILKK